MGNQINKFLFGIRVCFEKFAIIFGICLEGRKVNPPWPRALLCFRLYVYKNITLPLSANKRMLPNDVADGKKKTHTPAYRR